VKGASRLVKGLTNPKTKEFEEMRSDFVKPRVTSCFQHAKQQEPGYASCPYHHQNARHHVSSIERVSDEQSQQSYHGVSKGQYPANCITYQKEIGSCSLAECVIYLTEQ
jgi:hypothetical protein